MKVTVKTDKLMDGSKVYGVDIVSPYQSPALQGVVEKIHVPCPSYRDAVTLAHQLTRSINEHSLEVCVFQ